MHKDTPKNITPKSVQAKVKNKPHKKKTIAVKLGDLLMLMASISFYFNRRFSRLIKPRQTRCGNTPKRNQSAGVALKRASEFRRVIHYVEYA